MARHSAHRSLMFLGLLLLGASGIFVHQVSPLRDPLFQPNGANAGTLLPWLRNLTETDWGFMAAILAAILATMLTIMIKQQYLLSPTHLVTHRQRRSRRWLQRFDILLITTWAVSFSVFWLAFIGVLLNQWIID